MDVAYLVGNRELIVTTQSAMTQGAGVAEQDSIELDGAEPDGEAAGVVDAPVPPRPKKKKKKKAKKAAPPPPRRLITWPRVIVAAVLVALLVAVGLLWGQSVHNRRINSARSSAVSAAQRYARDFGTYDYRNLDAGFALIASELTGSFKSTYSSTAQSLKATVIKYQERSSATVQGVGVTSVSPHHAVVIVLLDQTVTSINSTTPVVNRNRAVITLVRSGGKWLMSGLDLK
jgi:Mce-associated membrane protein